MMLLDSLVDALECLAEAIKNIFQKLANYLKHAVYSNEQIHAKNIEELRETRKEIIEMAGGPPVTNPIAVQKILDFSMQEVELSDEEYDTLVVRPEQYEVVTKSSGAPNSTNIQAKGNTINVASSAAVDGMTLFNTAEISKELSRQNANRVTYE